MKIPSLKKLLGSQFTFMMVPHRKGEIRQFNIPLSLIVLFLAVWTGITFWGSYLSARHIDYWRAEVSNQVLNLKIKYMAHQLQESRSFLDEVKQIEVKLRDLLNYKSKESIITNEKGETVEATGGPTLRDQEEVTGILANLGPDITWARLVEKIRMMRTEAKSRIEGYEDLSSWIDDQRVLFRATPRGWPCPGHLSSHFGRRKDPFTKQMEYHYGVDISGPDGTPIRATADGVVKISNWHSGYGKMIVIQHKYGYSTRYAHNGRLLVKVGDKIKRGHALALMGNTGKSSGPHCHYEVWRYNKRVNPYAYLKGHYPKFDGITLKEPQKPSSTS